MFFELNDSEGGKITSVSIEISKLTDHIKEYLENNVKIKDKRFIINTDMITLDELNELNNNVEALLNKSLINPLSIINDNDEDLQIRLDEAVNKNSNKDNEILNRIIIPPINKEIETKPIIKSKLTIENVKAAILKLLKERSMSAFEVAAHLDMQTLEISEELNKLRKQGTLTYKIIGNDRYFSLIK